MVHSSGNDQEARRALPELGRKARAVTLGLGDPSMGTLHPTPWSQGSRKEYQTKESSEAKCQVARCEPQEILPFERRKEEEDGVKDTEKCCLLGLSKTKSIRGRGESVEGVHLQKEEEDNMKKKWQVSGIDCSSEVKQNGVAFLGN